ncbi:hypothetical protein ACFFWC_06995 [Plantactinospora siamensis]|uniref:Uncharacterized protein n=1 Tax=Plantactinospora siamensis TaxID=555372 RepID=A0ABV6NX47_9ACTN
MVAVPPPGSAPASGPAGRSDASGTARAGGDPVGARWPAGPVTGLGRRGHPTGPGEAGPGEAAPDPRTGATPPAGGSPGGRGGTGRSLWWFGGAAGAILLIGLIVVLVQSTSGGPLTGHLRRSGVDSRAPLARACPAPTGPAPTGPAPTGPTARGAPTGSEPAPAGPRTVDREAGISYAAFPAPWQPWRAVWRAGTLRVPYRVGQHFVTEPAYDGSSDYHASILSAAVPAADNDALVLDLECVGRQVAADVRASYYPQPNTADLLRDSRRTLGGLPAWVTVFRLHFDRPGLRAHDELAAVACVDVGRPTAAILYVSIPGTHRQYDWVVESALASVRPA